MRDQGLKSAFFCCLLAALSVWTVPAEGQISIRLSVKAVLDPATGARQPGVTEAVFSNTVAGINAILDSFRRGYRVEWLGGRLINVGGVGQFGSGPSAYFDQDFHANPGLKNDMDADALADPQAFAFDPSAINIYITRYGGANWNICSFPSQGHILVINGTKGYTNPGVVLHEIGHYFNLIHTFDGESYQNADGSSCTDTGCNCAIAIGGDGDGVDDTIKDNECWASPDDISYGNFGISFTSLPALIKPTVDRIWWNVMSYHVRQHAVNLLTSDQLDRWTDAANGPRVNTVNAITRFVDLNASGFFEKGSSGLPYLRLIEGVVYAKPGDIVLMRAGHYNEPMTITKPLTLRASRGDVVIGTP
jgi:hypothetical protein